MDWNTLFEQLLPLLSAIFALIWTFIQGQF